MMVSVDLNEHDARAVANYAEQEGICKICGEHFEIDEMEADHIKAYMAMGDGTLETMRAVDDVNHHRNLSRTFSSVDELMEELNA